MGYRVSLVNSKDQPIDAIRLNNDLYLLVQNNEKPLKKRAETNAMGLTVYFGEADPDALETEAKWRIWKQSFDAVTNAMKEINYADGSAEFDKKWSLRDTYTYS